MPETKGNETLFARNGVYMADMKATLKLFFSLLLVGAGVATITTLVLYNISVESMNDRVVTMARSCARIIDSVAVFDAANKPVTWPGSARMATLSQVRQAQLNLSGFGETGEYVLGELKNDKIQFLLTNRKTNRIPASVKSDSDAAAPMRLALLGKGGVIHASDYIGDVVIAGYQPLPHLNAGFVAKINLKELQTPHWHAYILGLACALGLALLGWFGFTFLMKLRSVEQSPKRQFLVLGALTASLLIVAVGTATTIIGTLYSESLKTQTSQLTSLNKSLAALIESVAKFDKKYNHNVLAGGAAEATLVQIKEAMRFEPGFEASGEFVIGKNEDGFIKFLLPSRFDGKLPSSVPFVGDKAGPMRKALNGKSGLIIDRDYLNREVFAAFDPINVLSLGLVTKIAMHDVRRPFEITGIANACFAVFFVVFGLLLAPKIIGESSLGTSRETASLFTPAKDADGWNLQGTPLLKWGIVSVALLLTLLIDVLTPLGVAAGIPFLVVVVVSAWFLNERGVLLVGLLSSLLLLLGIGVSETNNFQFWNALVNRLFALSAIWFVVLILLRNKRMEQSLRQSESQMFTFIDSAPDATIIVNSDGIIRMINRQVSALFGYESESLLGKPIEVLLPESYRKGHVAKRNGYINDPEIRPMGVNKDFYALRESGERFPVEVSLSPIHTEHGLFVSASVRDISERKRMEQEVIAAKVATEDALAVVTSSIQYASRIQRSVLPPKDRLKDFTAEHFIVWEPRDVVGGDLYWCEPWGSGGLVMLGDCTGHGVPGAFMTLISTGALERALLEVPEGDSASLVSTMHQLIQRQLDQDNDEGNSAGSDDGLELGLCYIPPERDKIIFAGARMPLLIDHGAEIEQVKADKKGIGYRGIPYDFVYTNKEIAVSNGAQFFMTSDGIIDQVGGEKRRGFGKKRFIALLESLRGSPLSEYGSKIYAELLAYEGEEKRRDDVSIVGFKL